ncbi:hypothetical protein G3576_09420 [Roseomonas stagni]|uniref:Cyclic di-GMP-binding protein n=1 Tax=Falsiroseomonas algicola TaxID=2716930 RepID=A0A6M1LIZ9_9PROT|nr:hypothetical protein [Falsiroseomonas algicola]NGM20231.1 hypothetical protein [Falsiroseomonas algicola]
MRPHRPTAHAAGRCLVLAALTLLPLSAAAQQRPARPAARPPVAAQPLPPPTPVAPPPLERHVGLDELGLEAGLAFGTAGREVAFALPRDIPGLAARASFAFDLVAPFAGRQAVEVWANGRVLASRAFAEGETRLTLDLPIPAEDLARDGTALRLGLRLVDQGGGALATLRADSHLALLLPDGAAPSVATLFRLLPRETRILTRPGPLPPAEAAAALRIGLALAGSGREVRIGSGAPPSIGRGPGGQPLWTTGAVVVGLGPAGAAVLDLDGMPALALGGPQPEQAAGLLDGPWRDAAAATTLSVRDARAPDAAATALPFSALRGATLPQEGATPGWAVEFSLRDLPGGGLPQAIDLAFTLTPDAGGWSVATATLNDTMLGSAALPAEGPARLSLPVPPALLRLDNRLVVTLQRPAAGGLAQLMPDSMLRLAPPAPARDFLALPGRFAGGVEVILDSPDGGPVAEALNPVLWLLRSLVPATAPVTVTLREGAAPPRPTGPFIAVTAEPPAGSQPALRFDAGRLTLSDRDGRPLLDLEGVQRLIAAQLVTAEGGQPGLWLRLPTLMPALPAAAPRLERGDVALLDGQGVALAWSSQAPAPEVRLAYAEAPATTPAVATLPAVAAPAERSAILVWRPWVLAVLWVLGFALVVYAFLRPRRGVEA